MRAAEVFDGPGLYPSVRVQASDKPAWWLSEAAKAFLDALSRATTISARHNIKPIRGRTWILCDFAPSRMARPTSSATRSLGKPMDLAGEAGQWRQGKRDLGGKGRWARQGKSWSGRAGVGRWAERALAPRSAP